MRDSWTGGTQLAPGLRDLLGAAGQGWAWAAPAAAAPRGGGGDSGGAKGVQNCIGARDPKLSEAITNRPHRTGHPLSLRGYGRLLAPS